MYRYLSKLGMHSALRSLPGRVEKGLDRCVVTLSTTYTTQTEMDGGGEVRENEMEGEHEEETRNLPLVEKTRSVIPSVRSSLLLSFLLIFECSIMNDRSLVNDTHCDSPASSLNNLDNFFQSSGRKRSDVVRCLISFFFFFFF